MIRNTMWFIPILMCAFVRSHPPRACVMQNFKWNVTSSGLRYIDDVVGDRGSFAHVRVGIKYNLSKFADDEIVETTGSRPREVDVNDTLWKNVLHDMQLGGKRSVLLSPADLERRDLKLGTTLKLDLELTELGAWRYIPTRRGVLLLVYLLSFFPYVLPEDERPGLFQSRESHLDRWLNDADFWGAPRHTVSSRAGKGAQSGSRPRA